VGILSKITAKGYSNSLFTRGLSLWCCHHLLGEAEGRRSQTLVGEIAGGARSCELLLLLRRELTLLLGCTCGHTL